LGSCREWKRRGGVCVSGYCLRVDPERVVSGSDSPFATETMAMLLDEQGHTEQAEDVRATLTSLDTDAAPDEAKTSSRGGGRVVDTLERWLDNLRRDA